MIRRRRRPRATFMLESRGFILAVLFLVRAAIALQFQTVGSPGLILVDALDIDRARLAPTHVSSSAGR